MDKRGMTETLDVRKLNEINAMPSELGCRASGRKQAIAIALSEARRGKKTWKQAIHAATNPNSWTILSELLSRLSK